MMKRIDILKEAHKILKNHDDPGICLAIKRVFCNNGKFIKIENISDYFPLFTLENAKKFGAINDVFWWKIQDYNLFSGQYGLFSGRRRFMRWLMWQYRNDNEEII